MSALVSIRHFRGVSMMDSIGNVAPQRTMIIIVYWRRPLGRRCGIISRHRNRGRHDEQGNAHSQRRESRKQFQHDGSPLHRIQFLRQFPILNHDLQNEQWPIGNTQSFSPDFVYLLPQGTVRHLEIGMSRSAGLAHSCSPRNGLPQLSRNKPDC